MTDIEWHTDGDVEALRIRLMKMHQEKMSEVLDYNISVTFTPEEMKDLDVFMNTFLYD